MLFFTMILSEYLCLYKELLYFIDIMKYNNLKLKLRNLVIKIFI
jgi:hypothetical protein